MTAIELAKQLNLTVITEGNGAEREIHGIYCCDLLSIVMGRAKADDAWITVMGNINAVAVAVLSDVSCIILSEGMTIDEQSIQKANEQQVCILQTDLPTYEISQKISKACQI
jgi:serine kinase of HPr protein (carbohydrate metabolism regulator)